jgi:hypothetical protein
VELAEYLRDLGYMPEQVQDFYPTPSTISTCMYYTGVDPRTMEPVYVPVNPHEKAMQRALIQYRDPKNYDLVIEALHKAGRTDLIGFDQKCLVRPRGLGANYGSPTKNGASAKNGAPAKNGASAKNRASGKIGVSDKHIGNSAKSKNDRANSTKSSGRSGDRFAAKNTSGTKNGFGNNPKNSSGNRSDSARPQKKKAIRNIHKKSSK